MPRKNTETLTTSQVTRHDDGVTIQLGQHDVPVPGPLGAMLLTLIADGKPYTGIGSPATSKWLFPGLLPGDRWCVTALNWLRAHNDGCAAPVVLASTHERTLEVVPIEALLEHQVDVPDDLANL